MLPSQASRLAALVKYEVEACGLESFEANVQEVANAMGNVAWSDTVSTLALANLDGFRRRRCSIGSRPVSAWSTRLHSAIAVGNRARLP